MSYSVVRRCGSDLVVLCLWHRPAAAALIQPLAWEHPCAVGVALKRHEKKKKTSKYKKSLFTYFLKK